MESKQVMKIPGNRGLTSTKIGILLFCLFAYLMFKPALLILFPGVIFFFYKDINFDLFKTFAYSVAISIAYWTSGFWLLKFIDISFSNFILLSVIASVVLILIKNSNNIKIQTPGITDLRSYTFIILVLVTLLPVSLNYTVPPGADMATHTYIARLIYETNTFPKSYEPIAPSDWFGSSPIGLSILIAQVSIINPQISIERSGLAMVVFSYVLFAIALLIFLRRYFSFWVSTLTAFTVIWLGPDLLQYSLWGGIPTILSIAQLLFLINFILDIGQAQKFSYINAVITGFLAFGSFSTHHIPSAVFVYITIIFTFLFFKDIKKYIKLQNMKFIFVSGLVFLLFFSIFLTSFKPPSPEIINYIKDWQRDFQIHSWKGTIYNAPISVPFFIAKRIGSSIFIMALFGILLSLTKNYFERREIIWSKTLMFLLLLFVINSQYWFLPLSPLLYPDRLITLAFIPMSLFVGIFYEYLGNNLKGRDKKFMPLNNLIFLGLLLMFGLFLFIDNYRWFYDNFNTQVSVTNDDKKVFQWITSNTLLSDVIQNNYGDAGVWIPTLTYRKITNYDGMIYDIEDIRKGAAKLKPTYLFIGSKPVYTQEIPYNFVDVAKDPKYEAVYRSGDSWLFKINK